MLVVETHVGLDGATQLGEGTEFTAPDPLGLRGMEERFHVGVVLAVVGPAHGGREAVAVQHAGVVVGAVFRLFDVVIRAEVPFDPR